ncbi:Sac2 family-domain-containing protein, partial [Piptocephalis cylindrospora]
GTFQTALNSLRKSIDGNHDALGLLLCIRINGAIISELSKRRIPGMDDFTHATSMLLWPRFQWVMDRHIESVRKVNVRKMPSAPESQMHPVMKRYTHFASSLLQLNHGYNDGNITTSITRLRSAIIVLMETVANEWDSHRNLAFLINNAHLTLETFSASRYTESETEFFRGFFNAKVNFYADKELQEHFSILLTFLQEHRPSTSKGKDPVKSIPVEELDRVSGDFNAAWRQRIAFVSTAAMKQFSNFKVGQTVLQATLSGLLLAYTRFTGLIERQGRHVTRDMAHPPISEQTLLLEMKKFRGTF